MTRRLPRLIRRQWERRTPSLKMRLARMRSYSTARVLEKTAQNLFRSQRQKECLGQTQLSRGRQARATATTSWMYYLTANILPRPNRRNPEFTPRFEWQSTRKSQDDWQSRNKRQSSTSLLCSTRKEVRRTERRGSFSAGPKRVAFRSDQYLSQSNRIIPVSHIAPSIFFGPLLKLKRLQPRRDDGRIQVPSSHDRGRSREGT